MLTNTRHHALNELGGWFLCVYFYLWLVSTARNTRVHMRLLLASHFFLSPKEQTNNHQGNVSTLACG